MTARPSCYAGRRVALLTQHHKETVIAPVLEPALGCTVELVTGFDTDTLGTFTRDRPRPGSQLEAARRKARAGMALAGSPFGLASEGSFGPDPYTGIQQWNVEMLVWIDEEQGLEIVGLAQGAASGGHLLSGEWSALAAFAESVGFPQQQLVLRPDCPDDLRIDKGIAGWAQLRACFEAQRAEATSARVFAEPDWRACASAQRMRRIGEAAADLLGRLLSCCPACDAPGYWVGERLKGLPCAECGLPTAHYRGEVWACLRCDHRAQVARTDRRLADPAHCDYCNP